MTPLRRAIGLLALVAACAPPPAHAQPVDPTVKPDTRSPNCTVSGCHASTLDHTYLHGPTAVSDCRTCHDDADVTKHTFVLKRQGADLCNFCHIDKSGTEGPVVHKPMADGECLACHDPHGSAVKQMIKFDSIGQLCTSCHTETTHSQWLHEPVKEGDCTACHSPHTADYPNLLVKQRRELCLTCHAGLADEMKGALTVHEPATGDCLECHNSHGSDHAGLLKQDTVALCTSCHQEQLIQAQHAAFPHDAVLDDRACLNCHTPHASSQPALQYTDPVAACLACHSGPAPTAKHEAPTPNPAAPVVFNAAHQQAQPDKQPVPEGTVANADTTPPKPPASEQGPVASDLAQHLPIAHGPVVKGECAACHDVHGGAHSRLLKANYTDNFYEPFNENAYELCLSCHDKNLLLEDHTYEATRFRDGERNLHALHVKGDQGRTCRACHNTHASKNKAMVRETSPYGQWMLPINFIPSETGGSCAPGCHKPKSYTRSDGPAPGPLPPPPAESPPTDTGASGAGKPAGDTTVTTGTGR